MIILSRLCHSECSEGSLFVTVLDASLHSGMTTTMIVPRGFVILMHLVILSNANQWSTPGGAKVKDLLSTHF